MKIDFTQSQIQNNKSTVENKSSKSTGSEISFSSALSDIGKSLASFIPQINANSKVYQTDLKKIKAVADELNEGIPTLEDEAEKILGKIEKLMEKYGNSK